MIITIDTHFYLAMAKGTINTSHILLVPVKHVPNTLQLTKPMLTELWYAFCGRMLFSRSRKWKNILTNYFAAQNEVVLFYEHNQPVSRSPQLQHLHIQV